MRMTISLVPLLLLGACASGPPTPEARAATADREAAYQDELADALGGRTAGEPVSCINLRNVRSVKSIKDRTLIYTVNSRLLYRTEPYGGCNGVARGGALITRTPSNQLCRGDIARVVDFTAGFESGSCAIGEFTPYRK